MSGTTRTSADLDARRRQILYRAWHRGMREMDLIMGRFADAEIGDAVRGGPRRVRAPDRGDRPRSLGWITGEIETPQNYDTALFRRLKAFHYRIHGAASTA